MQVLTRNTVLARSFPSRSFQSRAFSSRPACREHLDLAYDYHPPPNKEDAEHNAPILFLHGLFGSKKNNRSMSKALARNLNRPIYALDLRNHGDSPHSPVHTYTTLAADVESFIHTHSLRPPCIIGHSMGAKAAMTVALRSPSLLSSVISVDNAPVDAALKSDFGGYVRGMKAIESASPKSQKEADKILEPYAPELPIRQFLLTNLVRKEGMEGLQWRIPLKYLANALDEMAAFPFADPEQARFEKPVLFVRGTRSHYVPDETIPIIGRFFPRFEVRDVEAGHWVISENPEEFRKAAVEFLESVDVLD